jgi:hypothetical protein
MRPVVEAEERAVAVPDAQSSHKAGVVRRLLASFRGSIVVAGFLGGHVEARREMPAAIRM